MNIAKLADGFDYDYSVVDHWDNELLVMTNDGAPKQQLVLIDIEKAEKQAEIVTQVINTYEGAFVSTGRTLAEIINLPATILSRLAFISGILEQSEGPENNQMHTILDTLKQATADAEAAFNEDFEREMAKLQEIIGN